MNIRKLPSASKAFKYPLLIKSILAYSTMLEPENEIVYKDQVRYNYFELNRRVRKQANVFKKMGLDGGQTIAVLDYDSHRYLECFFGIPMTGNVLHTINWRLSAAQILYTINHAEDVVIICHSDFLPLLESVRNDMTTVKSIIVCADGGEYQKTSSLPIVGEYEELLAEASDEYDFEDFEEDAVATTFYTTGTTGNPKGVYFTHRQLVLHTLSVAVTFSAIDGACRFNNSDVYMPLTPMFHVHAWGFPYVATMCNTKQVYIGKFDPETVLKCFVKEKATFSHCVPTILQMFVTHPATQNIDLSKWKVVIGGSALPKTLAKAALERGVDVITGYGMSETCPILSTVYVSPRDKMNLDIDFQVDVRTRSGTPAMFVDIRLLDDEEKVAPRDGETIGEVTTRSPWLTQGYFNEPEKSEELWRDGWLHTGDVATMREDNSLKITDRIKDVIKTGGEWVSSIDLENLIGQHESVMEVAVIGIPDVKWGERPHAMIVLREGKTMHQDDLKIFMQRFVDEQLITAWTIPSSVTFASAIPKTSVGKIDKKVIRAMVHGER
ncbi:MAG: fatty acid--CoA ligase [Arcicella sp.]|nr:fatty acid--CoA ligase [Arcicella sp.]